MTDKLFEEFTDKYLLDLNDTWENADSEGKKRVSARHFDLLNSGANEWNDFIEEIVNFAKGNEYLLDLISFNFINEKISINNLKGYDFRFTMKFENVEFEEDLDFSFSTFQSQIFFENVKFNKKLTLSNSPSEKLIGFHNCEFFDELFIGKLNFSDDIVFNSCTFYDDFIFISNKVKGMLIIDDSYFKKILPDLRGSRFEIPVVVSDFKYDEKNIIEWIEAEQYLPQNTSRFRVLKDFAQQNNDHLTALKYFSYEMKSEEKTKDQFSFISLSYRLLSNYGRSVVRPLISLLLIIGFFLIVNFSIIEGNDSNCNTRFNSILIITINNSIPFNLAFDKPTIDCAHMVYGTGERRPLSYQVLDLAQKILSYLVWFLLVLSLRNRFKI